MTDSDDIRREIEGRIAEARRLLPSDLFDPLAPDRSLSGIPAWRVFEHQIWSIGEKIRQLLLKATKLRTDIVLQDQIAEIACDRRAHCGRQSFIMLLGYRSCVQYAGKLSEQMDDPFVDGHIINTLYKMRALGYSSVIIPFFDDKVTWVRNEAKRYLAWEKTVK
jgi:hypothetical protein